MAGKNDFVVSSAKLYYNENNSLCAEKWLFHIAAEIAAKRKQRFFHNIMEREMWY